MRDDFPLSDETFARRTFMVQDEAEQISIDASDAGHRPLAMAATG